MSATAVFAGGGTGGHIFPAIAIAQQLAPTIEPVFVCSTKQLDARIIRAAGHEPVAIHAQPFAIKPLALARFVRAWGGTVRAGRALIRARPGPVVVVAMGGYVAPPVVQAGRAQRAAIMLVNLDATPGKANRWIARHAHRVVSTVPIAGRDWPVVGPIVRREAIAPCDAAACRSMLGLEPDRPTLLVTGASQGARSLNLLMARFVQTHPKALARWQVIHQGGTVGGLAQAQRAYQDAGIPALAVEFLDPMGPAWGACDLALSRAGAGSVAEARANSVPAIFVPFPGHRDEHQAANAREAAGVGAAVLARDQRDAGANLATIGSALAELLPDADRLARMAGAWSQLGAADGAPATARIIESLLGAG